MRVIRSALLAGWSVPVRQAGFAKFVLAAAASFLVMGHISNKVSQLDAATQRLDRMHSRCFYAL